MDYEEKLHMEEWLNELYGCEDEINEAVQKERTRCYNIVQAARSGDIDGNFRSIAGLIDSDWTVEELLEDD